MRNFLSSIVDILVNGKSYSGNDVVIINDRVFIDNVDVTPDTSQVVIEVNGNLNSLTVDACKVINVHGSVNTLDNKSGDIVVGGDVSESLKSVSGDIQCNNVNGCIECVSGDIEVGGDVNGPIQTVSGDITT